MSDAPASDTPTKPGLMLVLRSMWQVKTFYMAIFGFASGLPFALFLGTLYAWLSEAEGDLETMGGFSLIGLAYAFQFLWSPLIDKVNLPVFRRLGRRKQLSCQMSVTFAHCHRKVCALLSLTLF